MHALKLLFTVILVLGALVNLIRLATAISQDENRCAAPYWGVIFGVTVLYFMWRKQIGL